MSIVAELESVQRRQLDSALATYRQLVVAHTEGAELPSPADQLSVLHAAKKEVSDLEADIATAVEAQKAELSQRREWVEQCRQRQRDYATELAEKLDPLQALKSSLKAQLRDVTEEIEKILREAKQPRQSLAVDVEMAARALDEVQGQIDRRKQRDHQQRRQASATYQMALNQLELSSRTSGVGELHRELVKLRQALANVEANRVVARHEIANYESQSKGTRGGNADCEGQRRAALTKLDQSASAIEARIQQTEGSLNAIRNREAELQQRLAKIDAELLTQ
jgi:DNA repair exonuclease SbcCD ATPase subunit